MLELLAKIVAEQCRTGDAAGVDAWLVQPGEGAGQASGGLLARIVDAKLGISERAFGALDGIGMPPLLAISGERVSQVGDRLVVDGAELIDDCRNVVGLHAEARLAT